MKRCTESFTIWRDGAPVAFTAGQLVDDKHPILKSHKHLFEEPSGSRPASAFTLKPVEQATADPGQQRSLTPPAGAADGDGPSSEQGEDSVTFDPGEHNAPEVIEYLKSADEEERSRVLAAETAGKNRKGILAADLS